MISNKDIFGWSSDAWAKTLRKSEIYQEQLPKKNLKILEIGAGKKSIVSLCFDETESSTTIGFYITDAKQVIEGKLRDLGSQNHLKSSYEVKFVDVFDIEEKYDVIIMKSVMGGLSGIRGKNVVETNNFLSSIVAKNLNKDGVLISLDNGKSAFEVILSRFGARKNNWTFFSLNELSDTDEQTSFGFLSAFSFATRFERLGPTLDKVIFAADIIICMVLKKSPTIICSVLRHKSNA